MSRSNRSFVWDYFENLDPESAACKLCMKVLRRTHSSTSALSNHLRTKHEIVEEKKRAGFHRSRSPIEGGVGISPRSSPAPKRRARPHAVASQLSQGVLISSTQEFIEVAEDHEGVEVILAKLVTVDDFPLSSVIRSDFVREVLAAKALTLPNHPDELALILLKHADHLRSKAMEELADLARIHMKFSLSLSEWQSAAGARYFGVNCHGHGGMSYSLGMIRIHPEMKASAIWSAVQRKIGQFGLNAERDIVGATTDQISLGASHPQLCLAHGIHQAVLKVLYRVSREKEDEEEAAPDDSPGASPLIDAADMAEEGPILVPVIRQLIGRVQTAIKAFMQPDCQIDLVVEQGLDQAGLLSAHTPWLGLLSKIESLLRLKELLGESFALSEDDWDALANLVELLRPLQMGLDALYSKDSTLLSAEGVCVFMLLALEKLKGPLVEPLRQAIKDNVTQRRQHELVSLLKYLNNPRSLRQVEKFPFQRMPNRSVLERTAFRLGCRLFPEHYDDKELQDSDAASLDSAEPSSDLSTELQRSIDMATYSESLSKTMREQMNTLDNSGQICEGLQLIQQALSTLTPTCMQMRRCVPGSNQSGFEHFGSGHPARLLDALIFLKGYYDQRG